MVSTYTPMEKRRVAGTKARRAQLAWATRSRFVAGFVGRPGRHSSRHRSWEPHMPTPKRGHGTQTRACHPPALLPSCHPIPSYIFHVFTKRANPGLIRFVAQFVKFVI